MAELVSTQRFEACLDRQRRAPDRNFLPPREEARARPTRRTPTSPNRPPRVLEASNARGVRASAKTRACIHHKPGQRGQVARSGQKPFSKRDAEGSAKASSVDTGVARTRLGDACGHSAAGGARKDYASSVGEGDPPRGHMQRSNPRDRHWKRVRASECRYAKEARGRSDRSIGKCPRLWGPDITA
jgi:hypothetical protein